MHRSERSVNLYMVLVCHMKMGALQPPRFAMSSCVERCPLVNFRVVARIDSCCFYDI